MKYIFLKENEITDKLIAKSNNTKKSMPFIGGYFVLEFNSDFYTEEFLPYEIFSESEAQTALATLENGGNVLNKSATYDASYMSKPFKDKKLPDKRKLFRRKMGIKGFVPAHSSAAIELVVPYAECKIDQLEIINCSIGDYADFNVKDNEYGTFSGYPFVTLEQFGYSVQLPDGFYVDSSKYDASLYGTMILEIVYYNETDTDKNIGLNFNLHEIL